MDVDPARIGTGEIADERLETRRRLEGIALENFEKRLGLRLQARAAQFLCVFCCLWRVDDAPRAHQSSDFRHSRMGVFNPFRLAARMIARPESPVVIAEPGAIACLCGTSGRRTL